MHPWPDPKLAPTHLGDIEYHDVGDGPPIVFLHLVLADATDHPFILVLAQFFPERDPFAPAPIARLAPFNHIGIELPTREAVDEIAAIGEQHGCLEMPPKQMPDPIGYICMLRDPDGNLVEFSYDQGVYETARAHWG